MAIDPPIIDAGAVYDRRTARNYQPILVSSLGPLQTGSVRTGPGLTDFETITRTADYEGQCMIHWTGGSGGSNNVVFSMYCVVTYESQLRWSKVEFGEIRDRNGNEWDPMNPPIDQEDYRSFVKVRMSAFGGDKINRVENSTASFGSPSSFETESTRFECTSSSNCGSGFSCIGNECVFTGANISSPGDCTIDDPYIPDSCGTSGTQDCTKPTCSIDNIGFEGKDIDCCSGDSKYTYNNLTGEMERRCEPDDPPGPTVGCNEYATDYYQSTGETFAGSSFGPDGNVCEDCETCNDSVCDLKTNLFEPAPCWCDNGARCVDCQICDYKDRNSPTFGQCINPDTSASQEAFDCLNCLRVENPTCNCDDGSEPITLEGYFFQVCDVPLATKSSENFKAESIQRLIDEECTKKCPTCEVEIPAEQCDTQTIYTDVGSTAILPRCPDGSTCRVSGTIEVEGAAQFATLFEICSNNEYPGGCLCESLQCNSHAECKECEVCDYEAGACITLGDSGLNDVGCSTPPDEQPPTESEGGVLGTQESQSSLYLVVAVFPDRIVLKNSTDSQATIEAAIQTGGSDAITQGELVLGIENTQVKFYTKSGNGQIVTLGGTAAGAFAVGDLTDTDLSTPATDDQVLAYNSVSGNWEPVSRLGGTLTTDGDILIRSGGVDTRLAIGTEGQYLAVSSGIPAWATDTFTQVQDDLNPVLGGALDVTATGLFTTGNGNIRLEPGTTGVVEVRGNTGNDAAIQLNCETNSHGVKIKSPPHSAAANYTLTLPNSAGQAGRVLSTDGNGVLSWIVGGSGGDGGGGRGDGGNFNDGSVDITFAFSVYGGGDFNTGTNDNPIELLNGNEGPDGGTFQEY